MATTRGLSAQRFLAQRGVNPAQTKQTPAQLWVQAKRQHASMPVLLPSDTASLASAWQPVGPYQVASSYFGKITGRVTSIAMDPSDISGNTVYVGTMGGGVWKSTNAAGAASQVTFTPLTDSLPVFTTGKTASLSIGAVSVQPGGTGVILAGTGDPNDSLDSYYGTGLLRSTDNGVTWSLIDQSSDASIGPYWNFSFIGEGFAGFAWSTTSPNLAVAAVSQAMEGPVVNATKDGASAEGLYYSTDSGASWHLATITDGQYKPIQGPGTSFEGWDGNAATSVVWNPIRKAFYAAIRYHGYYSSTDGITWTRLASQPSPQLSSAHCPNMTGSSGSQACRIFRGALAVQPYTGDMFAWTVDQNDIDMGLWQDTCNLQSGTCSSAIAFSKQIPTTALESSDGKQRIEQGTYNLWLAAVPSLSDTWLYTGTVDISHCSLLDNCAWRNTTNATTCPAAAMVAPSQHAVDFLPAKSGQSFGGLMFFGNDSGFWRTTDGAQQSSSACSTSDAASFDNLNGSLGSLAEIDGLAQDPTAPSTYLAGLGANGSTATSVASQLSWPSVLGGEGATTAIDPNNSQNWYATSGAGVSIQRCTLGAACKPAAFASTVIGESQVGNDGLTMTSPAAFQLDSLDSSQMLIGTCRVWLGPANGASWSAANAISGMLDGAAEPACNGNAVIRSLAASPSANGEWLFAGMAGQFDGGGAVPGHIFRSQWSGSATAWSDISLTPVTNTAVPFNQGAFAVSSIVPDPHDATGQTVYATIEGFSGNGISASLVYRSTDAGSHWANINSNLPSAPANALVVDPQDANTLYVALDTGVYITRQVTACSNPSANCWSIYGTGLPNSPVTKLLAVAGSNPMLSAGTYGRGIWQLPLAGSLSPVSTTTTASIAPATVTFSDQPTQTISAAKTIVLTNTGTIPLQVAQVSVSGDFSQQNNCPASVPVQGSCSLQLTFDPSALGPRTGALTVYANVPSGQLTASLSGNGIKGANIVLLPSSVDFGSIGTEGTAATQFVTISNIGGTTVSLGATAITGPFSLTADTCGATLAPTYGCTVGIAFSPVASGSFSGTFSITDDAGTQTALLTGSGSSPATDSVTPMSLTFPAQLLGTSSAPQQVTLSNDGDSALKLISAQTTGDFSVTSYCGASLAGHSSCAFSVVFHPQVAGAGSGTLVVSDLLNTHTVVLGGTGVAPAGISIAPGRLDFGGVGLGGSSSQTVTLTNNGGMSLDGIVFAVTGDFSIGPNSCGGSLGAYSSCSFQVLFTPSQAGARSGNLTVTSSTSTSFNMPLTGSGEDFQLVVVGSADSTVVTGQTAKYTLNVVSVAGSSGLLAISCSGAPVNSTCTISPSTAQLAGGNTIFVTVNVTTGVVPPARSKAGALKALRNKTRAGLLSIALLVPLGLGLGLRRSRMVAMLSLLACLFLTLAGCGVSVSGGSATASTDPITGNITPPGTYVLTISASEPGIQRTARLGLVVE
jgi:hypothetical protein